ncbi:hypothetical protein BHQ23_12535 [Mycobacterium gordonae]|jgi:hypothetical protein|uniref:Uncharacterized protein n=1 Tax=Mycobacterium gordonae TaxID=1778 RepID=A0A1X1X9W7_MYCGO|nr:hypothetical protein BHQ23_12535 [Mycobacterium gordonae]ORV95677.1 hypothetical protein AWC08_14495 [Mycobacterium gordonae]
MEPVLVLMALLAGRSGLGALAEPETGCGSVGFAVAVVSRQQRNTAGDKGAHRRMLENLPPCCDDPGLRPYAEPVEGRPASLAAGGDHRSHAYAEKGPAFTTAPRCAATMTTSATT